MYLLRKLKISTNERQIEEVEKNKKQLNKKNLVINKKSVKFVYTKTLRFVRHIK